MRGLLALTAPLWPMLPLSAILRAAKRVDLHVARVNRLCGGSAGLVGFTRAAVCSTRNYVCRLVTTSLRLIIPLSPPGPRVTISSSTTFSSVLVPWVTPAWHAQVPDMAGLLRHDPCCSAGHGSGAC